MARMPHLHLELVSPTIARQVPFWLDGATMGWAPAIVVGEGRRWYHPSCCGWGNAQMCERRVGVGERLG